MPHKTARLLGLCLVALSLLALHRAAARPPAPVDHGSVFRVNWGVSLPPPSKELYFAKSPRDFHGGGSRLLVYADDSGAVPRDMRQPDAHVRRTAAFILASLDDVPAAYIPPAGAALLLPPAGARRRAAALSRLSLSTPHVSSGIHRLMGSSD